MKNHKPDNKELRLVKESKIIDLAESIDPRRFRTVVVNADTETEVIVKVRTDANIDGVVVLLNRTLPCIYY